MGSPGGASDAKQYGGSSDIKKRTCIGSQSLTSDYIPKGSRISIFFKLCIYLTPVGLSCGSRDLFCITQDLSSWQGGSGVCRPCVCGTWAWFAGVQLQQPGIQPEELEGVGDDDVASDS